MANIKDFVVKQGIVAEGTAPSISTATGTLIIGGGAGIGGNVNIGGYIKRLGDVTSDTHSLGAQLSFRDAVFTDSLITGRTAWGIANYFGNPQLDTVSENATYTNATNIFIKGPAQAVPGGNLTIENLGHYMPLLVVSISVKLLAILVQQPDKHYKLLVVLVLVTEFMVQAAVAYLVTTKSTVAKY